MAGFPTNNSLYSPAPVFREGDDQPFGDRSFVVAREIWQYVSRAPARCLHKPPFDKP
jgi:hypothetical protein